MKGKKKMAKTKWRFIGSNNLYYPETFEEKQKAKKKAFDFGMKVNRMQTNKPKKIYKEQESIAAEQEIETI